MIWTPSKHIVRAPMLGGGLFYSYGGGGASDPTLPVTSDLELWYDADDSATITESGGAVSQWDDKSGNDYHVSQGTASRQPALVSAAQNSRNGILFDGSSDALLRTATSILTPGNPYTLLVCCDLKSAPDLTYPQLIDIGVTNQTKSYRFGFEAADTNYRYMNWGLTSTFGWETVRNNTELSAAPTGEHTFVFDYSGGTATDIASYDHFIDGTQGTDSSSGSSNNTSQVISIGANVDGASLFCNVEIYEIILYSAQLSTADRNSVLSYFSDKWAI